MTHLLGTNGPPVEAPLPAADHQMTKDRQFALEAARALYYANKDVMRWPAPSLRTCWRSMPICPWIPISMLGSSWPMRQNARGHRRRPTSSPGSRRCPGLQPTARESPHGWKLVTPSIGDCHTKAAWPASSPCARNTCSWTCSAGRRGRRRQSSSAVWNKVLLPFCILPYFPLLTGAQFRRVAALAAEGHRPPQIRLVAFRMLSGQGDPADLRWVAQTFAHSGDSQLVEVGRRFLFSSPGDLKPVPGGGLEFRSLGDCSLTRQGQPIDQGLRAKGKALFTLLMIREGKPVSREWLQNFLWPDFSERSAANNLRVTLHNLRKVLAATGTPDLSLESTSTVIKLEGGRHVAWDARALEQWVTTARHCLEARQRRQAMAAFAGAVDLYRGPFLAVGSLADYFPVEQRHYHRLAHEAMVRLATLHLEE